MSPGDRSQVVIGSLGCNVVSKHVHCASSKDMHKRGNFFKIILIGKIVRVHDVESKFATKSTGIKKTFKKIFREYILMRFA